MKEINNIQIKSIPGYENYSASTNGLIYSFAKQIGKGRGNGRGLDVIKTNIPKILVQTKGKNDRLVVYLGGKNRFYVHHLILITFVGERPEGMECCHKDGNPLNNNLSNLRWDTSKNNTEDQRRHGTLIGGEKHGNAKLTNADVEEIRNIGCQLHPQKIAEKYGVSITTIIKIQNNKSRTESSHNGKGV